MSSEMLDLFVNAFGETLLMVGVAGLLGGLIGVPLGILLYLTDSRGILQDAGGFGSWHSGGANVLFLDGTVRFLTDGMQFATFEA